MEFTSLNIAISFSIFGLAILAFILKKIDILGSVTGIAMAFIIWIGGGLESLFALSIFFSLGTFASSWKKKTKQAQGLAQENDGKRGISNVIGNGGVAAFLACLSIVTGDTQIPFNLMIVASFASACSDTFSSEFGNVYGIKYFNIINFKTANRGLDGVVSIEGLAFGIIGSLSIALSAIFFDHSAKTILLITACGFAGNLMDSILGATLQRRGYLNNHLVNLFSTLFASLVTMIFYL